MSLTSLLIFLYLSTISVDGSKQLSMFTSRIANRLSQDLTERTKKITNYHKIKEDFDVLNQNSIKGKLNGRKIILQFKSKIESIFKHKATALKNIKKRAEEEKEKYEHNTNIRKFRYPNLHIVADDEGFNNSLKFHPPFSLDVRVNMDQSFVQVPTNVYANSTDVLNTVKWTEKLDVAFKENYFNQSKETLLHQYYGDKSGMYNIISLKIPFRSLYFLK